MSPLWSILCLAIFFVDLCQVVSAGKKSQEDMIVINNGGGGGSCGGGAKTIVKTGGGKGKKGKGKGHKIILTSSSGRCGKEHKVSHIPLPIPVHHYEHHGSHGWGGGIDRRYSSASKVSSKTTARSSYDKGDLGSLVQYPIEPFHHQAHMDPHRMDLTYPMNPMAFPHQFYYGFNQMPYM